MSSNLTRTPKYVLVEQLKITLKGVLVFSEITLPHLNPRCSQREGEDLRRREGEDLEDLEDLEMERERGYLLYPPPRRGGGLRWGFPLFLPPRKRGRIKKGVSFFRGG